MEKSTQQINDFNELTQDIIHFSQSFIDNNPKQPNELDFSLKSLDVVETIIDEISSAYKKLDDNQQDEIANTIGSYVFEVARKNFGGKYFWYEPLNQPILVTGQPNFEVSILAIEKVRERFQNGKEDNIPFYFAGYVENVKNKHSCIIV